MFRKERIIRKIAIILVAALSISLILTGCDSNSGGSSDRPAASFPNRPITLIVPLAAGGGHDLTARPIVSCITPYLGGTPMVAEIKSGAGGAIGSDYVAKSNPDGYTLLFGGNAMNVVLPMVEDLAYNSDDFVCIAKINQNYLSSITVHRDSPFQTLEELIEYGRQNPNTLRYPSTGLWGGLFMQASLFTSAAGIEAVHVPYESGGQAVQALLSREVDFSFSLWSNSKDHYEAGTIRYLATYEKQRSAETPDIPAITEFGFGEDVIYNSWRAVFAPKDTPQEVVDYLREAFRQLCTEDTTFINLLRVLGDPVNYVDGPDFQIMLDNEISNTQAIIDRVGK